MLNEFTRSELLLGKDGMDNLSKAHVAVFGVGGVGSFTMEALARTGVGKISLFDNDTVSLTNINRQLIATHDTVGKPKVLVACERIKSISPKTEVFTHQIFYTQENASEYPLDHYDYIVDAIDTVSSKLLLIEKAKEVGVPIISCMGAGNKLDPTQFEVTDISKTSICPLAKVMRRELKKRGIYHLKVVYSKEPPLKQELRERREEGYTVETKGRQNRPAPGSIAFVPSVAGFIAASVVIKELSQVPSK